MSMPPIPAPTQIIALNEAAKAGLSYGPEMITGQGWRAFTASYQPGASAQYAIYEKVYISDEYWTTNQRFLFANWWLNNSAGNQESANSNAIQIDIVTMVFADITGTLRTVPLSFGGLNSITLTANGGAMPQAWTDAGKQTYLVPPGSRVMIRCHRTLITPATDFQPGSTTLAYNQALGERVQVGTTSLAALATAGGISTATPSGNNVYSFGPIAGVAQGWDGREVPLMIGTSIEYGQGEPRYWTQPRATANHCGEASWFGRGMASTANGAKRLPNLNWAVPGGKLAGITGTGSGAGLYYRIAALALLAGQRLPFTCTVCALGTNDGTTVVATWQALFTATWAALKAAWNVPLIQVSILQRMTSSDGFQTTAGQAAFNSSYAYPAASLWQINNWIRSVPNGNPAAINGAYIDRSFDITDAYAGVGSGGLAGTWNVAAQDSWTATVATAATAGATGLYLNVGAPPGAVLAILDGTGGYETAGTYASAYSTGGNCFITLTTGLLFAHAIGVTVKLSNTLDGTHPAASLNQLVGDGAVANAKLAGMFRF
ncbi:MAG: hypothetical protein M3N34_03585 [Pseudomonadota bacterium]|nr:hypothetical protein [Pseudomonadota bacterium]